MKTKMTVRAIGIGALAGLLMAAVCLAGSEEVRFDRRLSLEPGGRFVLDVDSGSVTVKGGSASGARVVVTSSRDDLEEFFDFTFEDGPGTARVSAEKIRRGLFNWSHWSDGSLHFEVEVPRSVDLEVDTSGGSIEVSDLQGEVHLDTSGGGIRARSVKGSVVADTSGGRIEVEEIDGDARLDTSGGGIEAEKVSGDVMADTSGGGISLSDIGGDIEADTSGGPIDIREAGGRVSAETSGGPVRVTFAAGNGRGGDLETSGGPITARVDPAVSLDIEASSSGGRVRTDLPITVRGTVSRTSLRGTLNGGGATLHLYSSGGGVTIESR